MEQITAFFAMGGYAGFVWTAFGTTALVLGALFLTSRRALKTREATLAGLRQQTSAGEGDRGD